MKYSGTPMSILWLLMPWLLRSPGHQQSWYWPCAHWDYSCLPVNLFKQPPPSRFWEMIENVNKSFMFPIINSAWQVLRKCPRSLYMPVSSHPRRSLLKWIYFEDKATWERSIKRPRSFFHWRTPKHTEYHEACYPYSQYVNSTQPEMTPNDSND